MADKVTIDEAGDSFVLPLRQEAVERLGLTEGQSADLHLAPAGFYLSVAEAPPMMNWNGSLQRPNC